MKKKKSFLIFKATPFFLLILLLISLLLISGCTPVSNLLFGPSGSIEVSTYPSGAKIFLNDKDTGHVTPYTIINLAKGTYKVKVTLDDISYTETVMVYSNHTTSVHKDLFPRLNKIIVQPSSMNLEVGESQKIDSIVAYYVDSGSADISLSDCTYSSSSNHATVSSIGTIGGASEGSATITVFYTEEGITKTDTIYITINPLKVVGITRIDVLPSSMNLEIEGSETISSITAHYDDASSKSIALGDCSYSSSDSGCATVDDNGTITGVSDSLAVITVSYTEDEITKTDTVEVIVGDIEYRALCVGVGDYLNDDGENLIDLLGPPYDVDRMIDVFNHCKFGTDEVGFIPIVSLKDLFATKTAIISGIVSTFSAADGNDISYFYFSGHGSYTGTFTTSYILPTDVELSGSIDSMISVDELESVLSAIPGRKVVILDSCFSGGFIGKNKEKIKPSKENIASFNDNIINTFSQIQSKGLLTTNQYKVLTSCHYNEPCLEYPLHPIDNNPFGLFTAAFCCGCGYDDGILHADTNENTKVTLQEAYLFIVDFVNLYFSGIQDVQVHPYNSDFTIIEH